VSRYKAYPSYKDSGVEWLGKVPSEWKLCPLKFMARIKNGQDYKRVEADEGYPVIGSGGQFSYASQFTYDKASVLLGRKGTIDRPLYINEPFWTVDTMYYTQVNEDVAPKFLYYLALTIQFSRYATNTALPSMTQENLGNYVFAIPTNRESRKNIAAFLDHETAKIDALIEKQQRLIELLKEKRQAVISQAVTKGLNPNAPMKDSGVEWLGEVPAHWDVLKLGYLMKLKGGAGFPDSYQGQEGHEIPFYKVGDLARANSESCLTEPLHTVTYEIAKELRATIFNTGSIVFAKVGAALLLKRFCTLNKPSCIDNNMMGAEIRPVELRDFLLFVMPLLDFELIVNPGAVPSVNGEQITSILIALPPQDEQIEIVDFLKTSRIKFDHLIRNAEQAISLFQERRTALIAAAVTGKIDVRDWQAAA
jgi:type I restriction enzyme S subunit